jgi:hypothetical protein
MKKICRLVLFVLCLAGITAFMPLAVQAANVTRTLQPGRVYTFTGQDRRVISHINVTGTGRYQYVAVNNHGDVVSYGFSVGRVSVTGEGFTQVSPLETMTVSFDSARLALREAEGEALRQISLGNGQTLSVQNLGRLNRHIRTNQNASFDLVVTNASGGLTFLDRDVRFPQFSLPANGEAVMTAAGRGLLVYFPNLWYGEVVQSRFLPHPAIVTHTLREGVSYVISHGGRRNAAAATVAAEPLFTSAAFSYDFIVRDHNGFSIRHGETSGNRITVQPQQPMTVTPHMDADLFFPFAGDLRLRVTDSDAPAYYLLEAGRSVRISNSDPVRAYNVYISTDLAGASVVFDYTLENEDGIQFFPNGRTGAINVPPESILTIMAGFPDDWLPQELTLRFSDSDAITFEAAEPTAARYKLQAGKSLIFINESDEELSLHIQNPNDTFFDHVITDLDGEIIYLFDQLRTQEFEFLLLPEHRVHFTNPNGDEESDPIRIRFPLAWYEAGLLTEETDAPALRTHTLEAGEALRFDNVNTRYTMPLRVEAAHITRNPSFEYVLTAPNNEVLSYGTQGTGIFQQRYNSRLTIMPAGNTTLHVSYPAEWHSRIFRTVAAANPPLHHIVLRPGEHFILNNQTGNALNLSNNSAPNGSGYFIHPGLALPNQTLQIPPNVNPSHGAIHLPRNTTLTLIVGRGTDLHIWMPFAWARQLRLI